MLFKKNKDLKKNEKQNLYKEIDKNIEMIKEKFKNSYDLRMAEFKITNTSTKIAIFYIDGIIDKNMLQNNILSNLLINIRGVKNPSKINSTSILNMLKEYDIPIGELAQITTIDDCILKMVNGNTILLLDGASNGISLGTASMPSRSVSQPITESNIRGPFEGFNENLRNNTALIRKRLKTNELKMEYFSIGNISKTDVVMCYLENITDSDLIKEVKNRLNKIDIDSILDSGHIEHLIEDAPLSVFPQINHTEKPDACTAALNNGRVIILVDGSPFALVLPSVFIDFLSAPEDYYSKFYISTFLRILRYMALLASLITPAFYIALTTFHRSMIPTTLLIRISSAHAEVPFPATLEVILMELTFELLREAGLRLPKPIGQAVSIVGALVIGQGAVQAGLVSQEIVIIVALTGIASFAIPGYSQEVSARLLRFVLIILSSVLGILGLVTGVMVILIHLVSLRSFGVPYLSPLAPLNIRDWKDVFYKAPIWSNKKRPTYLNTRKKEKKYGQSMPTKTDNSINKV